MFQFHAPASAAPSRIVTATVSVPFSDGLLSLKRAVGRLGSATSSIIRFDLPPSVVDQLDTLQFVAVGGGGVEGRFSK